MGNAGAIGEIIVFLIYFILISGSIISLAFVFRTKRKVAIVLCLICITLVSIFHYKRRKGYQQQQLEHVGTYRLIDYPNCDSCVAVLKTDNTYEVRQNRKILEKGDWHFESGGDAFIVYMNDDKEQLGIGRFNFDRYIDAYNNIYNFPVRRKSH